MASRRRAARDLTGIRQRGGTYQVRVFAGNDLVTNQKLYLTGSARTEDDAVTLRDSFRAQVASSTAARTNATLKYLIDEWLRTHDVDESAIESYRDLADKFIIPKLGDMPMAQFARLGPQPIEQLYAELRHCRRRCGGKPMVDHRTGMAHECRTVRHRWPAGRPSEATRAEHDCTTAGCRIIECKPHACKPLAQSTLRQVHAVFSGAFKAAVRWRWITVNPLEAAVPPKAPKPNPTPPSPEDAARIVEHAWSEDAEWGTFVWFVMITGARRGEFVPLRWTSFELRCAACGKPASWEDKKCRNDHILTKNRLSAVNIRQGYRQRNGRSIEKDTKTHQQRRVSLDGVSTELLVAHWDRYADRARALGVEPSKASYVFSYAPDHSRPCNPDALTHRYSRMTAALGLDTHLHELRHYSATELLSSGVDLRTVAGRLGHAGGGTTTLRVYAAWVQDADAQAANVLAAKMPTPGARPEAKMPEENPG